MKIEHALTFDDVLLVPNYSEVIPQDCKVESRLTKNITLNVPLISAAMDTVTESGLAIAMAQHGGIGCIHKNMSIKEQQKEVHKVKKHESGMVVDPITISPTASILQAKNLMAKHNISGIPVVDDKQKLSGILTNRDIRFCDNNSRLVSEMMTSSNLVTVNANVKKSEAKKLLHQHRIEKLLVVDDENRCIGLITVKDIEKSQKYPSAVKDSMGRLRVAAAVGVGKDSHARAEALTEAGVDVVIVDTAHGHSKSVISTVAEIKKAFPQIDIIAGNIATEDAAKALIDAGVDAIKVGIGPGSICTTRVIAGVGVPQLSAILAVQNICKKKKVPFISDGGIKYSGDLAKAIAAGASCVMLGGLFAGTEETPGEIVLYQGRSYKIYRGMGSLGAMARGSADRYFQEDVTNKQKLVPEGVEGRVPYKGSVENVIFQLVGGLKASMGYCGGRNIDEFQKKAKFIRITNAGLKESHPHDIVITQEAPNYGG